MVERKYIVLPLLYLFTENDYAIQSKNKIDTIVLINDCIKYSMMDYTEHIELVEETIQIFCRKYISENYNKNLEYLFMQKIDIQTAYKNAFLEQFEPYYTKDVERHLHVSSENLVYSLSAFLRTNPETSLEQILRFTETMISIQIAHFESYCEEVPEAVRNRQ